MGLLHCVRVSVSHSGSVALCTCFRKSQWVMGLLHCVRVSVSHSGSINNNNNEYLERLTRTGPKRLHVLYKYIFVKIQCIQHGCNHTRTHTHRLAHERMRAHARAHARARTHTHTHTQQSHSRAIRAMRLKKSFF